MFTILSCIWMCYTCKLCRCMYLHTTRTNLLLTCKYANKDQLTFFLNKEKSSCCMYLHTTISSNWNILLVWSCCAYITIIYSVLLGIISLITGQIERRFINVPIGASWVEVTMRTSGFDTPRKFFLDTLQVHFSMIIYFYMWVWF